MPAALLAAFALQITPETLADLERSYDQSCNSRAYGQFDDICSALEAQLKDYRAELRRRPHPAKAPVPPPATASPVPPTEPPPVHEPLAPSAPPRG